MPSTDGSAKSSRVDPGWWLLLGAILLLGRIAFGVWESAHPPVRPDLVHWRSESEALAEAQRTGKAVMYEFSAEWCGPCQQLAKTVFTDEHSVRSIETAVVPVHVVDRAQEEGRNPPEIDALQKRFAVDGFPTLVVLDPASGRVQQTSGYGGDRNGLVAWIERSAYTVRTGTTPKGLRIQ